MLPIILSCLGGGTSSYVPFFIRELNYCCIHSFHSSKLRASLIDWGLGRMINMRHIFEWGLKTPHFALVSIEYVLLFEGGWCKMERISCEIGKWIESEIPLG